VMQRVVKPRNQKAKRALEAREPKAIENTKKALFLRGLKCSDRLQRCMKDLAALKRPHVEQYGQKNDLHPFEDATKLEGFGRKEDASLFAFGCHSKKRPDNLVLGRMFDGHLLDMVEMGLVGYKGLAEFKNEKVSRIFKIQIIIFPPEC
jgi:ribosome production factor 2